MAGLPDIILQRRKPFAACDADLPFDEIISGDQLSDRMFNLQPGVHFHEVKGRVAIRIKRIGIKDELDGPGTLVVYRGCGGDRGDAQRMAQARAEAGGRGLLNHFLMAALQGAIAFKQMHDIAVAVSEHLNLDMAGTLDQFFDQHAVIAE